MSGPKFTVLYEKLRGQVYELDRETMSIGRRDGMDICIKDTSMSGHHADLICSERDGKKIFILRDNDSTNGTKVNGVQISEQELKNSDVILFGSVEILFDSGSDDENGGGISAPTSVTLDLSSVDAHMSSVPKFDSLNPLSVLEGKKNNIIGYVIIGLCIFSGIGVVSLLIYLASGIFNLDAPVGH